jgi:hypothetical protein
VLARGGGGASWSRNLTPRRCCWGAQAQGSVFFMRNLDSQAFGDYVCVTRCNSGYQCIWQNVVGMPCSMAGNLSSGAPTATAPFVRVAHFLLGETWEQSAIFAHARASLLLMETAPYADASCVLLGKLRQSFSGLSLSFGVLLGS